MKLYATIGKIVAALAAVAGIVYLLVKYIDTIKGWLDQICPCCELEDDFVVEDEITEAPVTEAPVEEAPAEEAPTEAPVEETPVAEETDFEA